MSGTRQTLAARQYKISGSFGHSASERRGLSMGRRRAQETILSDAGQKAHSLENRILGGLSRKEYARIAPDLQRVTVKADQVLYEPGVTMQWAYFLDTASVS